MGQKSMSLILASLLVIFSLGCEEVETQQVSVEGANGENTDVIVDPVGPGTDPSRYICDPFDPDSPTRGQAFNQGIAASMFYLNRGEPHYQSVYDYFDYGHEVTDVKLYFSQLNVPTRPFDQGFMTESGEVLQTPSGDTLYENFALHFESQLQLGPEDQAGRYQLAVLSDDGSVLSLDAGNGWETWIDNDGLHPTRMACATKTVELKAGESLPFELDYYQGPRYHIALMLLWRRIPDGQESMEDSLCGQKGNDLFFHTQSGRSQPQRAFHNLLDRGWRVVQPENFRLPNHMSKNPCYGSRPVLSDYQVTNISATSAELFWRTDRLATSEVLLVDGETGEKVMELKQEALRISHSLALMDLQPDHQYMAVAISRTAQGGAAESPVLAFRTLPAKASE